MLIKVLFYLNFFVLFVNDLSIISFFIHTYADEFILYYNDRSNTQQEIAYLRSVKICKASIHQQLYYSKNMSFRQVSFNTAKKKNYFIFPLYIIFQTNKSLSSKYKIHAFNLIFSVFLFLLKLSHESVSLLFILRLGVRLIQNSFALSQLFALYKGVVFSLCIWDDSTQTDIRKKVMSSIFRFIGHFSIANYFCQTDCSLTLSVLPLLQ